MAQIVDWRAILADGRVVERQEVLSLVNIPAFTVQAVAVATDSPQMPFAKAVVDPGKGQEVSVFTRNTLSPQSGERLSVPVIEVTPDPNQPRLKVRLFLTSKGPVLTTGEIEPKEF